MGSEMCIRDSPFAVLGTQFTRRPYDFERVNLEIIGAANDNNDGELLTGFNEKLLSVEIVEKTGIVIPSRRIYNFSNVNGIGLFHLNVFSGIGQQVTYKLWVYSYAISGLPNAQHATQFVPEG